MWAEPDHIACTRASIEGEPGYTNKWGQWKPPRGGVEQCKYSSMEYDSGTGACACCTSGGWVTGGDSSYNPWTWYTWSQYNIPDNGGKYPPPPAPLPPPPSAPPVEHEWEFVRAETRLDWHCRSPRGIDFTGPVSIEQCAQVTAM